MDGCKRAGGSETAATGTVTLPTGLGKMEAAQENRGGAINMGGWRGGQKSSGAGLP